MRLHNLGNRIKKVIQHGDVCGEKGKLFAGQQFCLENIYRDERRSWIGILLLFLCSRDYRLLA